MSTKSNRYLFPSANIFLDLLSRVARHAIQGRQVLYTGRAHGSYRTKMLHQSLFAFGTNARYLVQYGFKRPIGAQLSVVRNTKTVRFVADALYHIETL